MDNRDQKLAELEALLFLQGEPLPYKKIDSVLKLGPGERDELVAELEKRLAEAHRGLALVKDEDKIQLATKPEFNRILEDFVKDELSEDLSPASLEALALIAYLGPISRSKIEYLRGVNSTFILRSLLLRGLVERFPDPHRANSFLYRLTFDLLKHLGLNKKEDLPEFGKFQQLLRVFDAPPASSEPTLSSPEGPASPQPDEAGSPGGNQAAEPSPPSSEAPERPPEAPPSA